jgi:maltose O-acetyltransferase
MTPRGPQWHLMVSGELYDPLDPELVEGRAAARALLRQYNVSVEGAARADLLERLLGSMPRGLWIEPPFYCDYGTNIVLGRSVYMNFNCVILDVAPVTIGDNVMMGPAVQIYTASHPLRAAERNAGREYAKPIVIGSDVWIGGGAVVNPGVIIGRGSVIGSGSVVTRSIPADCFAAGNPCRVIREIDQGGSEERPEGV